ncbi:hypothetical protein CLAIMM_08906 [Cladophialophora immunda]|nr:hypothetical protein CLAIMM_08906 [Cladophialophora immunda]
MGRGGLSLVLAQSPLASVRVGSASEGWIDGAIINEPSVEPEVGYLQNGSWVGHQGQLVIARLGDGEQLGNVCRKRSLDQVMTLSLIRGATQQEARCHDVACQLLPTTARASHFQLDGPRQECLVATKDKTQDVGIRSELSSLWTISVGAKSHSSWPDSLDCITLHNGEFKQPTSQDVAATSTLAPGTATVFHVEHGVRGIILIPDSPPEKLGSASVSKHGRRQTPNSDGFGSHIEPLKGNTHFFLSSPLCLIVDTKT